jgi:hypothetical protein
MMHRLLLIGGLLLLAGCKSVVGPFEARPPQRVDDPLLSIGEQQRRGRDRLALPDQTDPLSTVGPRTYAEAPNH